MKKIGKLFLFLIFCAKTMAQEIETPTVVELFTSQGCSSCPSADVLLSQMIAEKDANIIGLSFHVNYWNYLGWKDPYSSEQFTERQKLYATIKGYSVYTPQMIMDGREAFVGSDRKAFVKNWVKNKNNKSERGLKVSTTLEKNHKK